MYESICKGVHKPKPINTPVSSIVSDPMVAPTLIEMKIEDKMTIAVIGLIFGMPISTYLIDTHKAIIDAVRVISLVVFNSLFL